MRSAFHHKLDKKSLQHKNIIMKVFATCFFNTKKNYNHNKLRIIYDKKLEN